MMYESTAKKIPGDMLDCEKAREFEVTGADIRYHVRTLTMMMGVLKISEFSVVACFEN